MVGRIERDKLAFARDAGIAGRAIKPLDERARRDLPGQRMLAPAGAEEEDVHGGRSSKIRPPFRYAGSVIAAFVPGGSGVGSTSTRPPASRTR